jgi:microcystin-dependent protein
MEGYIGEIRGFAAGWAPRNWSTCQGQLLAISSNTALFSIIGCEYGGDCRTTFALPDLRGRAPIGQGTGPGLTPRVMSQRSGQEYVTLTQLEMPMHTHAGTLTTASAIPEYSTDLAANETPAAGNVPAKGNYQSGIATNNVKSYGAATNLVQGAPLPISGNVTIGQAGGSQSHNNMQPYLVINWIICLFGIFPSRN